MSILFDVSLEEVLTHLRQKVIRKYFSWNFVKIHHIKGKRETRERKNKFTNLKLKYSLR